MLWLNDRRCLLVFSKLVSLDLCCACLWLCVALCAILRICGKFPMVVVSPSVHLVSFHPRYCEFMFILCDTIRRFTCCVYLCFVVLSLYVCCMCAPFCCHSPLCAPSVGHSVVAWVCLLSSSWVLRICGAHYLMVCYLMLCTLN